jgi:hypothetical protein
MGASRRSDDTRARPGSRGQTTPFVVLALALVMAAALVVAHTGVVLVARARAEHAADAAALAGAVDGRAGAETAARANDATLVEFHTAGDVVTVTVERGGTRARASAQFLLELRSG